MGRRSYDMGDTKEGYVEYEHQVPIFVVTPIVSRASLQSTIRARV